MVSPCMVPPRPGPLEVSHVSLSSSLVLCTAGLSVVSVTHWGAGPCPRISAARPPPIEDFPPWPCLRPPGRWEADPANTSAAQSLLLPAPRVLPSSPGPLAWAGPVLPGLPLCGLGRLSPSLAPTIGLGRPGDPRLVGQSSGRSRPAPPPLELQPWPSHPF